MDWMNYKEGLEALYQAGFTTAEITRLAHLRRMYIQHEQDQTPADLARLRFIRWLVQNGKLTDQFA
jgi:hypothetical protein